MDECAPDFLVGVFIVARGIVEGTQEFFTANLIRSLSAHKLFDESAYCSIIGDSELVRMTAMVCLHSCLNRQNRGGMQMQLLAVANTSCHRIE